MVVDDTERLRTMINILIRRKRSPNEIRFDSEWKEARKVAANIIVVVKHHLEEQTNGLQS